jgi:GTP:adenosylcobinamide-phosphate guanylyltransferase
MLSVDPTSRGQTTPVQYAAVIMAGCRGPSDPVARAAGISHKCLVEVVGVPMLTRVIETLESSPYVAKIVLCVEQSLENIPGIDERVTQGTLVRVDAAGSPAASALRAMDALGHNFPLLIVTADHPLLDARMLQHFCSLAPACGDVAVGLARAALVLEHYAESTRTLLKFSDGARCGCNIFALNTQAARAAVVFWTQLEAQRKRPWRLIRMLGVTALFRYWCGRLSLAATLATLSLKLGIKAQVVDMPFAEAAIDVDKPADLELVESILRERSAS